MPRNQSLTRSFLIVLLAGASVVASVAAYLYQKAFAQHGPTTSTQLSIVDACVLIEHDGSENTRKELYISCAGFLE